MDRLLKSQKPLIGVLHLPPLPGSPQKSPGMTLILEGALRDAKVLVEGGAAGLIVENLGDAPFSGERVEPHVTAMLAVVAKTVVDFVGTSLCVGVNALRNDSLAALGAAAASGASFVRINVHTGVMATDQGLIQGRARESLLYRKQLGISLGIAADVLVKHATPLGDVDPVQLAKDTFYRGGADVLIYTGSGTGRPVDALAFKALRKGCPGIPFWIGSGVNAENVGELAPLCEGAIVGSFLHMGGDLSAPLDLSRVRLIAKGLQA
jgi:membrane complex biogenesis BtpA family protein